MKKTIIIFSVISCILNKGFSQVEKGGTQFGAGALPIFDAFKLFPDNKLSGIAVSANFGYFAINRMSIGFNPYYAQATNSYSYYSRYNILRKEQQNLKLYGLNAYMRYAVILKNKISVFPSLAFGFGVVEQKTFDFDSKVLKSRDNAPTFILSLGIGINYFITKNIALELHIPYIHIIYLTAEPVVPHWQTIAPTIGLQFYFPGKN